MAAAEGSWQHIVLDVSQPSELESCIEALAPRELEGFELDFDSDEHPCIAASLASPMPNATPSAPAKPAAVQTSAELREQCSRRWLRNEEVLAVLEQAAHFELSIQESCVQSPPSGSVLLFTKRLVKNFRSDGYVWRNKKSGRGIAETHERLKVDGAHQLVCYYAQTEDGSISRRIYSRLDDKDTVLVHYLAATQAKHTVTPPLKQTATPPFKQTATPPLTQTATPPLSVASAAAPALPSQCVKLSATALPVNGWQTQVAQPLNAAQSTGWPQAAMGSWEGGGAGPLNEPGLRSASVGPFLGAPDPAPQAPPSMQPPLALGFGNGATSATQRLVPSPSAAWAASTPCATALRSAIGSSPRSGGSAAWEPSDTPSPRPASSDAGAHHVGVLAASPAADAFGHEARIQELEERIRQLEVEKRTATAAAAAAAVAAAAAGVTNSRRAGGVANEDLAGELKVEAAPEVCASGDAGVSDRARADPVPADITPSGRRALLLIGDFSPEWDDVTGGAKMLLTAETVAGCRYAALFGSARVVATLVRPHVLRLHVPPAPAWWAASSDLSCLTVEMRLLQLSANGTLIQGSPATSFTYRRRVRAVLSTPSRSPPELPQEAEVSRAPSISESGSRSAEHASCQVDAPDEEMPEEDHRTLHTGPAPVCILDFSATRGGELSTSGRGESCCAPASKCCRRSDSASITDGITGTSRTLGETGAAGLPPRHERPTDGPVSIGADIEEQLLEEAEDAEGEAEDELRSEPHSEMYAMALSLSSKPNEQQLERHFRALLSSLDDNGASDADRWDGAGDPRGDPDLLSPGSRAPADGSDDLALQRISRLQRAVRERLQLREPICKGRRSGSMSPMRLQDQQELISRVQRRFRTRRLDSRRHAALAIERFYRRRQVEPLTAGQLLFQVGEDSTVWQPSSQGESLIRSAQVNFRARQHRKQAVRVIERAYGEWKYHAEQARLAAEGDMETGRDAALHTYHSERRERAARCIQGYLQRQQHKDGRSRRLGSFGSHAFPEDNEAPYNEEQLDFIRRAQRAFRAHVRKQAEEAQALHAATRSSSAIGDAEHLRLCEILRRAASGATLSADEQASLARVQQAFRENLERKRRAAGIISSAFRRSSPLLPSFPLVERFGNAADSFLRCSDGGCLLRNHHQAAPPEQALHAFPMVSHQS